MKKNELKLLIEEMSGIHDGDKIRGSETKSWAAYRKAEKLDDLKIVDKAMLLINESSEHLLKANAYRVLCYILKNTKNEELKEVLLSKIKLEDENDETLYALLMGLLESNNCFTTNIEDVIFFIDDERPLIRNASIRLLAKFDDNKQMAIEALEDILENYYDEYDYNYAKESIKKLS